MRKLHLLPILMVLIFLAPSAFAGDSPCHYSIKRSKSLPNHGEVTCLSCKTLDDYSMYGAAHMVNSGDRYKSMTVKNAYGNKHVFVSSNAHIVSRGISINLGPFISWDFNRNDRSHQAISSYVQSGSVSGKPWYKHPVANSAAVAKCKAIPAEEKEAAQEIYKKMKEVRDPSAYYENLTNQQNSGQHVGNFWVRSIEDRHARTIVCTTGGTCTYSN